MLNKPIMSPDFSRQFESVMAKHARFGITELKGSKGVKFGAERMLM